MNGHVKPNNNHSGSKLMEDGSAANKRVRRTSEMEVQLVDIYVFALLLFFFFLC